MFQKVDKLIRKLETAELDATVLRRHLLRMFTQGIARVTRRALPYSWLLFTSGLTLLCIVSVAVMAHANRGPATTASVNASVQGPAPYPGIDLQGATAPGFTLQDQSGAVISLSQFYGHPVVITFFDSVCPHEDCSLIAEYINMTAKDLGSHDTNGVVWLAISVNPWHDTPASANAFLKSRQVQIPIHYLLGTEKTLSPIWNAYHMQAILQSNGIVIHTTGLFLIDSSGRERTYFAEGFDPKVASQQIHRLLTQSTGSAQPTSVSGTPTSSYLATASDRGYRIAFTATPGQFGSYDFSVTVQDPSGVPLQGAHIVITLTMPEMVMTALDVPLAPIDPPIPGSYQARGVLSMAGVWQATVSVTPGGAQTVFHFTARF